MIEGFVVALLQTSFGLKQLSVVDRQNTSRSPRGHIPRLGYLPCLTVFNAQRLAISPNALMTLSALPFLRTLKVCIQVSEYEDWDVLPHGRISKLFHTLTTLSIATSSFEWIIAFFNIVTTAQLQEVDIQVADTSLKGSNLPLIPPQLLHAFCGALRAHPSRASIRAIHLVLDGERPSPDITNFNGREKDCPPDPDEFEVYCSQHLTPLLALRALRDLYIHSWCGVYPTDAFLARASRAWPHLNALVFKWTTVLERDDDPPYWWRHMREPYMRRVPAYSWNYPPCATLAGLIPLARGCKYLRYVSLYLDAENLPEDDPTSPVGSALHGRRVVAESPANRLHLELSPIGNPMRVAAFLSGLFPDLSEIEAHEGSQWRERWRTVKYLYREFKKVREQERRARRAEDALSHT